MSRKPKMPKVRHTWAINPKTRIAPSKKNLASAICNMCRGEGRLYMPGEADSRYEDCSSCGGTGYVN